MATVEQKAAPESTSLRSRVIGAGLWNGVARVGGEASRFVITIILARLLGPAEFGLIALVTALMTLIFAFADFRIGYALIHKPEVSRREWSTAFWFTAGLGLLFTLGFAGAAPFIAGFYRNESLRTIALVLACNFLLSSLTLVPKTMLEKHLKFKALAIVQLIVIVSTGAVAVLMALAGFGVWSLVVQSTVTYAMDVVLSCVAARWYPGFSFERSVLSGLFRFSGPLMVHDVLSTITQSLDRLILGKVVGAAELGLYSRAKTFLYLPVGNISSSITRVMFPALSSLQGDPERVRNVTLRMMKILAITSFPVMAGAAAITEPLVHVVLGPKWVEAIPLMRLFALIGLVGSLNAVTGVTFLANGETRLIMNLGFVNQFVALIAIVVGSFWGAMGCTFGGAISALQVFVLNGNFVCRTLSLSRYAYYQQVVLPLPAAVLMGISTYGLTTLLHSQGSVVTLIVAVVFGGLLYPALLRVTDHIGWKELRRLAGELKSTVNAAQFLDRAGWIRQGA